VLFHTIFLGGLNTGGVQHELTNLGPFRRLYLVLFHLSRAGVDSVSGDLAGLACGSGSRVDVVSLSGAVGGDGSRVDGLGLDLMSCLGLSVTFLRIHCRRGKGPSWCSYSGVGGTISCIACAGRTSLILLACVLDIFPSLSRFTSYI